MQKEGAQKKQKKTKKKKVYANLHRLRHGSHVDQFFESGTFIGTEAYKFDLLHKGKRTREQGFNDALFVKALNSPVLSRNDSQLTNLESFFGGQRGYE